MAYFPAAYKKVFVALGSNDPEVPMEEMTEGMFGFFDAKTWEPVPVAEATITAHPQVVFVLANPFHDADADKLGVHGGYTESWKSQVIDAGSITRFWKVNPRGQQWHSVYLGWNVDNYDISPKFVCGQTYTLRVDVKGSAALRYLGHHLYRTYSVSTPCCAKGAIGAPVDPIPVMLEFARQIKEDPLLGPFTHVDVIGEDPMTYAPYTVDPATYVPVTTAEDIANTVTGLQLLVRDRETNFTSCSFDPLDYDETEPLVITGAQWVNTKGMRCPELTPLVMTEIQAPLAPEGTPGRIIRDVLLFLGYRQEFYSTNARIRATRNLEKIVDTINANTQYVSYYILHTVPRHSNPTGVYDQDQYLLQIVFFYEEGDNISFLEDWMASYLASAGNGVVLEDLSGIPDPT